ncbi:MAG: glycosyltransferase family 4 protein [Caldilineaceae bacterium]|nr:glycosyltransferase family 4 protein [Caldilineaceae bacterium]
MNILVISNFYPPHHIGGYGMLCWEVVNGLLERGHRVTVLAGMHGVATPTSEGHIHRRLTLESDLYFYRPQSAIRYPQVKRRNLAIVQELIQQEQPDFVFIWGMWALTKEVAKEAERLLPGRVVYYLANPWPIDPNLHRSYWDMPANSPWRTAAKQLMRMPIRFWLHEEWQPFNLQFEHVLCCSAAQRDQVLKAWVKMQNCPVVYEGIDLAPYVAQRHRREQRDAEREKARAPLQLLFVGTLAEHKGVHTTIEALGVLSQSELARLHLTILGSGHPHYEKRLHQLVRDRHVAEAVTFHQPIPRAALPNFLGDHDVLLLPSIWEEPLARIMQEGLAAGMVVVGAATGGTAEVIHEGENGLLFPAADATALARQIRRLLADPALCKTLAETGQQNAIALFALPRMIDDIENYLVGIHEATLSHKSLSTVR